jgi:Leucine-rich repeat (LRR) protein
LLFLGEHLPGFNDNYVTQVRGENQDTLVIPDVICRQFPFLSGMVFINNNITWLGVNSVGQCSELFTLNLAFDNLYNLAPRVFANNQYLSYLDLAGNFLSQFDRDSFFGTQIYVLNLEANIFTTIENHWFEPIHRTLINLYLSLNQISFIPRNAFERMTALQTLELNGNRLGVIAPDVFEPAVFMYSLQLANTGLSSPAPQLFESLMNLAMIELDANGITELPHGLLNLPNLRVAGLSLNNLTSLDSLTFGRSLNTLVDIHATDNAINHIDPFILERTPMLDSLELINNVCIDASFIDIQQNMDVVTRELNNCFDAFAVADSFISCVYDEMEASYDCDMTLRNRFGRDIFTAIEGDHLENRNDNYVTAIHAFRQNTINIPEIICRQFRFIEAIDIELSGVEFIQSNAFDHCEMLYLVNLIGNNIQVIPDNIFANNMYVSVLALTLNNIERLTPNALAGSQIYQLDLSANGMEAVEASWFEPVGSTMLSLFLQNNRIRGLPSNVFASLTNLRRLDLAGNLLTFIPSDAFSGLTSLTYLSVANCEIMALPPTIFHPLTSLRSIEIDMNFLTELPENLLSIRTLEHVGIAFNNLAVLDSQSFGDSLGSITTLLVEENELIAIDSRILINATNLDTLDLINNVCVDASFIDVQTNIWAIYEYISECTQTFFEPQLELSCLFSGPVGSYNCQLNIEDRLGLDNFERIEGEHDGTRGDDDVRFVIGIQQNTRTIPRAICRQLPNLLTFELYNSGVSVITPETFAGCRMLDSISLNRNSILFIPDGTFSNNPMLTTLRIQDNRIRHISPLALQGSRVQIVQFEINQIQEFSRWFEPVNETLIAILISSNNIDEIPSNFFVNLPNLAMLNVNSNRNIRIAANAFESNVNMTSLDLSNCNLNAVHPAWFTQKVNLQILALNGNNLRELPMGVFNTMPNILLLELHNNALNVLDISAFGSVVESLSILTANNNRINAFDRRIFNEAMNLNSLNMLNNNCVSQNFINIRNNREGVSEALTRCFNNF